MSASNSPESSSLTTFRPISVDYPEHSTNHFHSFRYLPLDSHGGSTGTGYESGRNFWPDRQPNLLRQTTGTFQSGSSGTFKSGSSGSNRSDQNALLRHRNDSVSSKFGSSWNDNIQTLGNSHHGLNNATANGGFGWMNSPALGRSSSGDLHGSDHFLPRVSNLMLDRDTTQHGAGVDDVFAVSGDLRASMVMPYSFQNVHSDAESWWPDRHYIPHREMIPPDRKDPRYKIYHRDVFPPDMRPGSPSPSSFNYNTPAAAPKRSSLPKNFDDLDLSSKNQIEEIRRVYGKKNQSDAAARAVNQSPSSKTREKSSQKPAFSGDVKYTLNRSSRRGDYPTLTLEFYKDFGNGDGLDMGVRKDSSGDGSPMPSVKMREDFDETQRKRKRNHIIFLVIVMFIVAVAVISAVLASTLGSTQGKLKDTGQNYSIVVANLTLKILNRSFQVELLDTGSEEFKNLSLSYSTEVDRLFLKSKLAAVYSEHEILYFRNGSIYATSSITFIDEGLVKSSQDVENVISTAEVKSPDWKQEDDLLKLGEFFVCRSCAEANLEYLTVNEKPKLMSVNSGVSLNITDPTLMIAPATSLETTSSTTAATMQSDSDTQQETKNQSYKTELDGPDHLTTVQQPDETFDETLQQWSTTALVLGDESSDTGLMTMITTVEKSSTSSLDDGDVLIMCLVKNINGWANISIWHLPNAPLASRPFSPGAMIMTLDPTGLTTYGPEYSDRVRAKYDVNGTQILLTVQLYYVTCKDIGSIRSLLTDRTGRTFSRFAKVDVEVPAPKPKLTVPFEVIENRRMTGEVTCEAETGHPPWTMTLSARLLNGSAFTLPSDEVVTVDSCTTLMVRNLTGLTPSMSLNETVVECRIENPSDSRDVLSDSRALFVTQANACFGKSSMSYLPHPYNCSTYIECVNEVPSVKLCPLGQCFNQFLHKCAVDSKPLMFHTTHGVINHGLASMTCSVDNTTRWSQIGIGRKSPSGEQHYDLFSADGSGQVTWQDSGLRIRSVTNVYSTGRQIVLELWIFVLKCSDEGTYTCVAKSDDMVLTESVEFLVYGKSEAPTLVVPETVVQGAVEPAVVSCEADLGRTAETLTLKVRPRGKLLYTPVEFSKVVNVTSGSCLGKRRGEYVIRPGESLNGSTFRCEVDPPPGVGHLRSETLLSEEKEYFVIPNSTCEGVSSSLLPHPHDCRLFVLCVQSKASVLSCGPGHCFNVTSQQCDILAPDATPAINDNSCSPTKNLDYLPHGSLCDKFIECVHGNETVRHCPPSEMYSANGTCTTDVRQSFCYIYNRF